MLKKLIIFTLLNVILFASGGYDNGTATGKNKWSLDLTWNPFNKIKFGQSYAVISYGITDRIDLHGYISNHPGNYYTAYSGLFYQFYKSEYLDLATAIGIRKRYNRSWTHLFLPQLLYSYHINNQLSIGGSFVNVKDYQTKKKYSIAIDIAASFKLSYQSKNIDSVSFTLGAFKPTSYSSKTSFLPTYSIDIKFNL